MQQVTGDDRDRPPWTDPGLLGLAAIAAALVAFFGLAGDHQVVSWSVQTGLDVLIALMALRLARVNAADRYARRFWRTLFVACASCTVGDLYQTVLVAMRPGDTRISVVQTAFVVCGMAVVVLGMLVHPLGGTGRQRLRLWLDSGIVLAAVAVFLWYFTLATTFTTSGVAQRWAAAATSAVMLLIAFAVLKLLLGGTAPFTFAAGVMGSLGVAGTAVGASVTTVLTGTTDPRVMSLVSLLPCVLTAAALRMQEVQVRRRGARPAGGGRRRASRLPYVAVTATQILLIVALAQHSSGLRTVGVAVGTLLITALVLVRQSTAFKDNERLLAELEVLHSEMRHQATHDGLTGLANRALMQERLAAMPPDDTVTVLLIDLDGFKPVNDRYGHASGDRVLVAVAQRLAALVGTAGQAARLGGDEFVVLLPGAPADAGALAGRISAAVAEPVAIDGARVVVGASVGVATGRARNASRVLHDADAAMYRTKAERKKAIIDFVEQSSNYHASRFS
ncbi:MAG: GGDEF domain-containing protein [Actinoplanes sp.]